MRYTITITADPEVFDHASAGEAVGIILAKMPEHLTAKVQTSIVRDERLVLVEIVGIVLGDIIDLDLNAVPKLVWLPGVTSVVTSNATLADKWQPQVFEWTRSQSVRDPRPVKSRELARRGGAPASITNLAEQGDI